MPLFRALPFRHTPLHRLYLSIALLMLVAIVVPAHAQMIILRDVDVSGYPTIRARFRALDRDLKPVSGLSPSDFTVTEDGVARPVVEVTECQETRLVPLTVGIMVDTKYHINLARAGTKRLATFLQMPPSELGITTMDAGVYIVQDLTKNRAKALEKADGLAPAPGVDVQRMFYDPQAGGVPFVSGRPNRKALILISDLHCPNLNLDVPRLLNDAAREKISVYAVLLHANDYTGLFKTITGSTGGELFENVTNEEQINDIFLRIGLEQYGTPCQLAWESTPNCVVPRSAVIAIPSIGASGTISYKTPLAVMPHLEFSPSGIAFARDNGGVPEEQDVVVTARVGDVSVNGFAMDGGRFAVVDYGGSQPPFTLKKNESRTMRIRYESDSSYSFGTLEAVTDRCPARLYMAGGRPGSSPSLVLTHPNGGEEFVVGSDTVITWKGVLPEDRIRLEYSTDKGGTWMTIGEGVFGLDFAWHVPNTPSRECLARVTQLASGPVDSILRIIAPQPMHRFFWSPFGDEVATVWDENSALQVFSALDGEELARVPQTNGSTYYAGAWSPDGSMIAFGGNDGTAHIWSRAQQKTLFALGHNEFDPLHTNHLVFDLNWSPDGTMLATGSLDTYARVWDISTGALLHKLDCGGELRKVEWSHNGKILAASSTVSVNFWSIPSGAPIFSIPASVSWILPSPINDLIAISPITGGLDQVEIWDMSSGTRMKQLRADAGYIREIAWSPDAKLVATLSGRWLVVWDVASGGELFRFNYNIHNPVGLAWSPDGRSLACMGSRENGDSVFVDLLDPLTGDLLTTVHLPGSPRDLLSPDILWSPDGARLGIMMNSGLYIWDRFTGGLQNDVSDALWAIVAPEPELRTVDIDMGTVQLGRGKDSLVAAVLCNRGGAPLHVLGMDVTGGDVADFMIPSGAGDFTLAPGECRSITIEFMPVQTGSRTATVTVRMAGDTLADTIRLRGVGVRPVLLVESSDIDFGAIGVGEVKDTTVAVVLRNVGTLPLTISATPQAGPDLTQFSIIAGGAPFTIAPGSSHAMSLRFTASSVGRTTGRIAFEYNDVGSPAIARLMGRGLGGIIYIPDDSAAAGERFLLPLLIESQAPRKVTGEPQRFRAEISVDQTLLASADPSTPGIIDLGQRMLTVEGAWSGASDTLMQIPMVALLGSVEESRLELLRFDWMDGSDRPMGIESETRSGMFHLLGVCREGGDRLYDEFGVEAALKVLPNPASASFALEYSLAEDGEIAIELYDAMGRKAGDLYAGEHGAGRYRMELATDRLASGLYIIMLKTPTKIITGTLNIYR